MERKNGIPVIQEIGMKVQYYNYPGSDTGTYG
jgi:hypothetical protein